MATATTTTATTATTVACNQQRQQPLRGISIIIESEQKPASNIESDEMSLKSQSMLLAFGDNNGGNTSSNSNDNNSSNLQTLHVDHATKVDLETSYNTAATTTTAAATTIETTATKLYPQLLLRIGQTEAEVEAAAASAAESGEMAPATAATIISCNVAVAAAVDDVRNVLLQAETGEIAESTLHHSNSTSNIEASQLTSAVTETVDCCEPQHTVKIQIANNGQGQRRLGKQISVVKLNDSNMLQQQQHQPQHQHQQQQQQQLPYQLCYLVSSGQYSPCETLDSGTGSDLEINKTPDTSCNSNNSSNSSNNSRSNMPQQLQLHLKTTRIRVNGSPGSMHLRAYSLTDSEECDESSSSLSCDSLHSNEAATPALLPSSLLRDIREPERGQERVERMERRLVAATKIDGRPLQYEADQYYNFHVNEHDNYRSSFAQHEPDYLEQDQQLNEEQQQQQQEDAFVGYKDVRHTNNTQLSSTIRSAKGTVRGVKNRVRNGVATFLQLQQPNVKNYKEKDLGKVVLYTTSMGIIRDTYAKCANVKQILRTLLIKFEERDVFMSMEYQQEMRDRMKHETIRVPQLFVEGQHIGDADTVERLNESGELRQLLRPYKSIATAYTCQMCGGYRLLPCPSCSGSKKSVHRNHFTAEFVALKCMNCDEVGLVKCPNC